MVTILALGGCGAANDAQQPAAQATAAPVNYGSSKPAPTRPFTAQPVATFDGPWALAFLPDQRMLVTEKSGRLWLVTAAGAKTPVAGVPRVHDEGQGGLLFVATAPDFAQSRHVYLTYAEPGEGGDGLALARATLDGDGAELTDLHVIWRQLPRGKGGQFGGYIAFSPDGRYLFLTSGERQRFTPAQDPDQALGKILRLTLDGKPAPGNPAAGKTGATTIGVIDPPENTGAAAKAPVRKITLAGPNLTPAETWSTGHRNPYGLAFDAQGRLWETEMGPQGGDELNLIEGGRKLRLAPGVLRQELRRHPDPVARGQYQVPATRSLLEPGHRAGRPCLLQRQHVSRMARVGVRRRARLHRADPHRLRRRGRARGGALGHGCARPCRDGRSGRRLVDSGGRRGRPPAAARLQTRRLRVTVRPSPRSAAA